MNKIFALMLAVMLALMPVLGSAASPQEFLDQAWQSGRALNTKVWMEIDDWLVEMLDDEDFGMLAELINTTSVNVITAPEGPWKFALNLSDNEVLNVIGDADEELSYLTSTLLGGDVLAANDEEKLVIANYLIDLMAKEGAISEDDAMQIKMLLVMGPALLEEALSSVEPIDPASIDTAPVEAVLADWDARCVPMTEVPQSDKKYDTAATGHTAVLTGEDMVNFAEASLDVLMTIPQFVQGFSAALEGQDPEAAVDEAMAELRGEMAANPIAIPVTILRNEAGETVYVSAVVTMENVSAAVNGTEVTMTQAPVLLEYARKSFSKGNVHTVSMTAQEAEDEVKMSLEINVDDYFEQNVLFKLDMLTAGKSIGDMEIEWKSNKWHNEADAGENTRLIFDIDDGGEEMNFELFYAVEACVDEETHVGGALRFEYNGLELVKIVVENESCDPLPTLAGGENVRIGQLISQSDPDDENSPLNQYLASLQGALMQNVIVIAQNLPTSLMMLLLGE